MARARTTLTFFAEKAYQNHGWFYHWLNIETGEREWKSEVSSIDTALLMGGVLSVRQCFKDDASIVKHADAIYRRLDFRWMLNGHETLLSHGWHPETAFIKHRWAEFSEAMILYILGLGVADAGACVAGGIVGGVGATGTDLRSVSLCDDGPAAVPASVFARVD